MEGGEEEKVIELRSGVIPAAGYARKLRRVALAAFREIAPRDVIIRDISELNKQLYKTLVEEKRYDKTDLIRIIIEAKYDPVKNRIIFGEPKIDRFLPESKLQEMVESAVKELKERHEREVIELKRKYEEKIKEFEKEMYELRKSYDEKIERMKGKYEEKIRRLENEISKLRSVISDIKSLVIDTLG